MLIKSGNKSLRFKPHYNHSLGGFIHTSSDYLSEMKRQGAEPYDPSKVKKFKRKEYKPSKWAYDMIKTAKDNTDKDGNVHITGVMKDEFVKKGVGKAPDRIKNETTGGSYTD